MGKENYTIDELREDDLPQLKEILNLWIRFPLKIVDNKSNGIILQNEVEETIINMKKSIDKIDSYMYFVVRRGKKVLGIIGSRSPAEKLKIYIPKNEKNPIEMLNLFFRLEERGKDLELKLINFLHEKVKQLGYSSVWWDSGPRYKESHWDIFNKNFGNPIAVAKGFYDIKDSMIWGVTF